MNIAMATHPLRNQFRRAMLPTGDLLFADFRHLKVNRGDGPQCHPQGMTKSLPGS